MLWGSSVPLLERQKAGSGGGGGVTTILRVAKSNVAITQMHFDILIREGGGGRGREEREKKEKKEGK